MQMKITLFLSKHAKKRMAEKAINKEQIIQAIQRGSKFRQTEGLLVVYRDIEVAYRVLGNNAYKIKTVKIR